MLINHYPVGRKSAYSHGREVVEQHRNNCRAPSAMIIKHKGVFVMSFLAEGAALFRPTKIKKNHDKPIASPLFAMAFYFQLRLDLLPRIDLLERKAQPNPNNNSASYAQFCALS